MVTTGVSRRSTAGRVAVRLTVLPPGHFAISEAVDDMVVHHAGGLHERIADGRAGELPDVRIKRPERFLRVEELPGVGRDRLELEPVPDDAGIGQQAAEVPRGVARDLRGV